MSHETDPDRGEGAMPDRSSRRALGSLPDLFAEALALDRPDRADLVSRVRELDPGVAIHLEALLESSGAPSPVDTPLQITEARPWSPIFQGEAFLGSKIAGMEVVRILGSGGMGTVFEAQQLHPRRRVALKVLRPEAADSAPRLMLEAEALARLDHPSIAKVYGAGADMVQGRHTVWMAVEFVSGAKTLTEHADDSGLGVAERVKLMVEVARAIEHAHSKGVLHRDLKPANLLVSGDGAAGVKVIDFGVARITDPLGAEAREQTRHGELLGTLLYMSPEQCAGDPAAIDVRTDIYGLGIVLFRLLTGTFPYESEGQSMFQLLDTIRSGKRRRARDLRPLLDEDLDAVISQACAPSQDERYSTAGALADDLTRWLQGEPVRARRASVLHRVRLYARRRRAVFLISAGAAALFLLGGGIITSLMLDNVAKLREIERRDRAMLTARSELSSVTEILEGITARDPGARSMQARFEAQRVETAAEKRAVVGRAVEDLERLEEALLEDPNSWVQLARAFEQVGEIHGTAWNAGALDAGGRHLANLNALDLWRRVMGTGRGTEGDRDALFRTLVRLTNSSRAQGEVDFGKGVADEAVGMARQALSSDSGGSSRVFDLIDALGARADLSILDESPKRGLLDSQECVDLLAAYVPSVPADVLRKLDYESWNQLRLGSWLTRSGSEEEGAEARRRAREGRIGVIFASASLPEAQSSEFSPSRHVRLAWTVFGPLEVKAYRDLGDDEGAAASLLGLVQSAARLQALPPESYGPSLSQITALGALLADGDPSPEARESLGKVVELWAAQPRAVQLEQADELPRAIDRFSEQGVRFGPGSRDYLADLRARVSSIGPEWADRER